MTTPLARKLYLRIWLTVAGSVAVLGLLVGWAWHVADEQRDHEQDRCEERHAGDGAAAGAAVRA